MKKSETALLIFLVIILLGILGAAGYSVWKKNQGSGNAEEALVSGSILASDSPAGASQTAATTTSTISAFVTTTDSSTVSSSVSTKPAIPPSENVAPSMPLIPGWLRYSNSEDSVGMEYPSSWYVHDAIGLGGSLEFSSIPESDYNNGVLPSGAADIMVYRSEESIETARTEDSGGATVLSTSIVNVSGVSAEEVSYAIEGSGVNEQNLVVYLPYDGYVYRLVLDYHGETQFSNLFGQFIATFQFSG